MTFKVAGASYRQCLNYHRARGVRDPFPHTSGPLSYVRKKATGGPLKGPLSYIERTPSEIQNIINIAMQIRELV